MNGDGHGDGRQLVLQVAQGSDAWRRARLGIPTASQFKRILTGGGTRSDSAAQYQQELLREWLAGEPQAQDAATQTRWMRHGIETEPQARAVYVARTGCAVAEVGLVYRDEKKLVAASPDGLVGADGLLEIKCPQPSTHTKHLRANKIPSAYIPQVQGQLWVTGRQWCDFFSYNPNRDRQLLIRVGRDEEYIKKLRAAVDEFVTALLSARRKLKP